MHRGDEMRTQHRGIIWMCIKLLNYRRYTFVAIKNKNNDLSGDQDRAISIATKTITINIMTLTRAIDGLREYYKQLSREQ